MDNISVYEEYLFSKDQDAFIQGCTNAGHTKLMLRLTHLLNHNKPLSDDDQKRLNEWAAVNYRDSKINLVLKQKINQFVEETDLGKRKVLLEDFNKKFIKASFTHERKQIGTQAGSSNQADGKKALLKTALSAEDLKKVDVASIVDKIEKSPPNSHFNVYEYSSFILEKVDLTKIENINVLGELLNRFENFASLKNPIEALKKYRTKRREADKNPSCSYIDNYYEKLTLDQLVQLGKEIPESLTESTYKTCLFQKTFDKELHELFQVDCVNKQRELFKNLLEQVKKDEKNNIVLIASLKKALLMNGYEGMVYDKDLFLDYLKRPLANFHGFQKDYWKNLTNIHENYEGLISYHPIGIPEPGFNQVLEEYLNNLLQTEADIKAFNIFFREEYLNGILAKNKVLNGGSSDEHKRIFGLSATQALEDKKNLEILRKNKRFFNKGEEVAITLSVKNIPELTYKIFEVDTETFYKKNKSEISDSLDLDGLIPEKINKITYTQQKHHQHEETIKFDDLAARERGVFIIEFVGSGLSSRAVIRKGSLNLLTQAHFQGYRLYIVDENKELCLGNKTGLYIDNKYHKLNEQGFVLIPFGESYSNPTVIISHDGFNCLSSTSIGEEFYDLRSALIFNEESIVSGRKLQLIVKNKLFLNDKLITLKKFEEFSAELQLRNYDGVTNYKNFKDIKLSDTEDLILELIVPQNLTSLQVNINGKVKTLAGKDQQLAYGESIQIDRNENNNQFITAYLNRDQEGYLVELKGKNGEAIPNKQANIELVTSLTTSNNRMSYSLFSDASGKIRIGKVSHLTQISVSSPENAFGARAFPVSGNKDKKSISQSYNICLGEDLVLPSMGLEVSPSNFSLLKITTCPNSCAQVLKDFFGSLSKDELNQIVLKGLSEGVYQFKYLDDPSEDHFIITITVHNAQRWDANPLLLNLKNEILQVGGESRYLNIGNWKTDEKSVSFRVFSHNLAHARVHVMGLLHHSQMSSLMRQNTEQQISHCYSSQESFPIEKKFNSFRSNRVLSDEHQYVNERKNKQNFVGNTLNKPSILLHREKVRETKDDEEVLQTGQDFAKDEFNARACQMSSQKMMCKKVGGYAGRTGGCSLPHDYTLRNNLDFLEESGLTLTNIHPNDEGLITIPYEQLKDYSYLVVNVSDNAGSLLCDLPLSVSNPKALDMRVQQAKKPGLIYSEDFFSLPITPASPQKIEDLSSTTHYMVEDLGSLFDVMCVIADSGVNKTETQKWRFITSWSALSLEDKCKKLEEFGGHELHIFCYFRDRKFFDEAILPMLKLKARKQLIDHLLTGDVEKAKSYLSVEKMGSLSLLEGTLLVNLLKTQEPTLCKQYLASLKLIQDTHIQNDDKIKVLYESILSSKKIEEEPLNNLNPSSSEDEKEERREEEEEEWEDCERALAKGCFYSGGGMECMQDEPPMECCEEMEMGGGIEMDMDECMPMKAMKMDMGLELMGGIIDIQDKKEKVVVEKYQKKGAAFEFKERQEYFKGQTSSLKLNKFWITVIEQILENKEPLVLTGDIIEMIKKSAELVYALTFTDLPFERGNIDSKVVDGALHLSVSKNILVFCKRIEERKTDTFNMELIISQKFYDPEDKFIYDEKDTSICTIKPVKEYLIAKIYESSIAFTNVGGSSRKIKLITQVPEGSIPVSSLDSFKIQDYQINSMQTYVVTFKFYFPSAKPALQVFYPATIMANNKFVASSESSEGFKVVSAYSEENKVLETLQDILNHGTAEDIVQFMAEKNIHNRKVCNLQKVLWILKQSPELFKKTIKVLRDKFMYDREAWAYSLYHGCMEEVNELLRNQLPNLVVDCQYLKVAGIEIDNFEPLEYDPLINPRAHDISDKKHNILNKTFKETYERFLKYCIEKGPLGEREKIILVSYLVLQDRVQEALEKIKEIDAAKVLKEDIMVVQFEYLQAYLSIYTDGPKYDIARGIVNKYTNFPDLSWRKRFKEIQKQLKEYDTGMLQKTDSENKTGVLEKSNKELADRAEYLSLEMKDEFQLAITHKNVSQLAISFYKLEMEILFSNDPFLEKDIMNFVTVSPNHLLKFKLNKSSEFKTSIVKIPENLQKDSLFIQVKGKDKMEIIKAFNSHLRVHTIEDYGLLNVSDLQGKCLDSVYVKCFSKKKDGTVKFYKDGYTDFRGSFDFASLNSDSLNGIEKYGLFVFSKEHGSVILTTKPPSQVGRIVKEKVDQAEEIINEIDEEFADAPLLE